MGRKRAGRGWLTEDQVPSTEEGTWEEWGNEVLPFLSQPSSTAELLAKLPHYSRPALSNILCWLELRGLATRSRGEVPVVWKRAEPAPEAKPPPERCPRCGGGWKVTLVGYTCASCGRLR
jgi:hypothetical protein